LHWCFSRGRSWLPSTCALWRSTRTLTNALRCWLALWLAQNIWFGLRPEERCAVLEVTQDELSMLAENEWRIHGDEDNGQSWHMPKQTLEWIRKPGFCRGVQVRDPTVRASD
jgi:hypothetical protein